MRILNYICYFLMVVLSLLVIKLSFMVQEKRDENAALSKSLANEQWINKSGQAYKKQHPPKCAGDQKDDNCKE